MSGAGASGDAAKKRILVVDDDHDIARILALTLKLKYDVVQAHDGGEALAIASKPPFPQLILLDVMMPGMDGFALSQRLKLVPELKKVPLIFITAKTAAADNIRGIQAGARAYITKPFKLDDVLAKVQKALGG